MLRRLTEIFARPKLGTGLVVEIYGKPDCHLCEVATAELRKLQRRWPFRLQEVNIAENAQLLQEFGRRIPLIWVEGKLACKYQVNAKRLRRRLEEATRANRKDVGQ